MQQCLAACYPLHPLANPGAWELVGRVINDYLPPQVRGDFAMIRQNVELEARIIDDLLDLTRLTRGKLEIELRPLDLHLLLAEAVRTAGVDRQLVGSTPTLHLKADEKEVRAFHTCLEEKWKEMV